MLFAFDQNNILNVDTAVVNKFKLLVLKVLKTLEF